MSETDETERSNPYIGLRPFFFEDSLYFFGRDRQTDDLIALLRNNRFLGVVGSSGSGKSSLVRAGLLPMLLGGFLEAERDHWALAQVKPGDAPLANLAEGLLRSTGETATPDAIAALVDDIRDRHADAVTEYLGNRVAGSNILLLVDQFEELFAFRSKAGDPGPDLAKQRAARRSEATAYADLLLRLAEYPGLPIYVVLTMRTDFLGDCDLFYGLPEALNVGRYLVPRLSRDELRESIECPARLVHASVAPRLLDQLLNALGDRSDRLPVLQHALVRTFDEWVRCGRTGLIDLVHYEAVGGLERALNNEANAAMAGLEPKIVEAVFRRLTDTDINQRRVRSPARISELMAVSNVDRAAIDTVIAPFLETSRSFLYMANDGKPEDPRVDIAHESLIRNWDNLVSWTEAEQLARDTFVTLAARARNWRAGKASVLEGPERRSAIAWATNNNPRRGWAQRYATEPDDFDTLFAYLNASQKSLYRWRGLTIALPVAVLVSVSGLLGYSEQQKYNERYETVDKSVKLIEAMTTNMYSVIQAMPKSGDVRRELLVRARDVGTELKGYKDDQDSFGFWNLILDGDTYIDRLVDSDDPDSLGDATIEGAMASAETKYRAAVEIARERVKQEPDAVNWQGNLAIALGKYAGAAETSDEACLALKEVVELNARISAAGNKTYDWRFQRFLGLNALARFRGQDCLTARQNRFYYDRALKAAATMTSDRLSTRVRLLAIASELFFNGVNLFDYAPRLGPEGAADRTAAIAQFTACLRLFQRINADRPGVPDVISQLADTQSRLGNVLASDGKTAAAVQVIDQAIANLENLIRIDPGQAKAYQQRLDSQRAERRELTDVP